MFPIFSSKMVRDVFSGLNSVVSYVLIIPSYNLFCLVSLSYGLYTAINCIFLICIMVGARSVDVFVSNLVGFDYLTEERGRLVGF